MMELDDDEESTVPKTPCPKNAMMNEEKEGTKLATPTIEMGFNDASNNLEKLDLLSMFNIETNNIIDIQKK
jgi:hypothetical protein